MRALYATALSMVLCFQVQGAPHPCIGKGAINGIFDGFTRGGTFALQGDEQRYVLAGVFLSEPDKLAKLSGEVVLQPIDGGLDRYRRQRVNLFQGEHWIQAEAVLAGRALVFGSSGSAACSSLLNNLEQRALKNRAGVWRDGELPLAADRPKRLTPWVGRFVVVEGRVVSVGDRERLLYLNFGENWAQDFTVAVVKTGANAFNGNIRRLQRLSNRRVQVRGYLEERQGPLIRLVDDTQIKILP